MSHDQPPPSHQPPDDELGDVWDDSADVWDDSPTPKPAIPPTSTKQTTSRPTTPTPQGDRTSELVDKIRTTVNTLRATMIEQATQIRTQAKRVSAELRPILATKSEQIRPWLERVQAWWRVTLPKIRQVLPVSLNQQLSDVVITRIAIGLLVFVLWIGSGALFSKPSRANRVPAVEPSPEVQPTPTPKLPPAIAPLLAPPAISDQAPSTPPLLDLTPAQSLIAAIQDQVAEVSNQYADGLIQSVQANFRSSRLIVMVGNQWYSLSPSRQDKLAAEMKKRAMELNFNKLEITDLRNILLARSPVIGETMIILQRQENAGS